MTHAELGGIYLFDRKRYDLAARHYSQAIAIQPRSEFYSLGLFHALTNQNRWRDGLAEMCRFLEIRASDEYRTMLSEAFAETDFADREERKLVMRARELLAQRRGGSTGDT